MALCLAFISGPSFRPLETLLLAVYSDFTLFLSKFVHPLFFTEILYHGKKSGAYYPSPGSLGDR